LAYPEQGLKLQIYRLRRPEVLSLVPLIPLQKLPVRFSPGGLVKTPHILWFFFLTYYSLFCLYSTHPKASSYSFPYDPIPPCGLFSWKKQFCSGRIYGSRQSLNPELQYSKLLSIKMRCLAEQREFTKFNQGRRNTLEFC